MQLANVATITNLTIKIKKADVIHVTQIQLHQTLIRPLQLSHCINVIQCLILDATLKHITVALQEHRCFQQAVRHARPVWP